MTRFPPDLLILMAEGPARDSLRSAFEERGWSVDGTESFSRLEPHFNSSPYAVALVHVPSLSREGVSQLAAASSWPAVIFGGEGNSAGLESYEWVPESGDNVGRLAAAAQRAITSLQASWLDGQMERVAEGWILADSLTGELIAAGGEARFILGTEVEPGPGRKKLLQILSLLAGEATAPVFRTGQFEVRVDARNQRKFAWRACVADDDGTGPRVLFLSLRDRTVAVRWLERHANSEWTEALGALSEKVAHDFNNVLQAVVSHTELLRLDILDRRVPPLELVEPIENAAEKGVELTKRMLFLSGRCGEASESVDICSLLLSSVERLTEALGGEPGSEHPGVRARIEAADLRVVGNRDQLLEAIVELGERCLADETQLVLSARRVGSDEALLPGEVHGPDYALVEFDVQDRGVPVAADHRHAEAHHVELGTSTMAHRVVQSHGGFVEVESLGAPTVRCRVLLPLASEHRTPMATHVGRCALIVDDEPLVLHAAEPLFKAAGYDVYTAGDGEVALQVLSRHRDEIDFVVLDVVMPGPNPREVIRRMRALRSDLPILLATGRGGAPHGLESADSVVGVLNKPFGIQEVEQVLQGNDDSRGRSDRGPQSTTSSDHAD